jgi:hypothetical protein
VFSRTNPLAKHVVQFLDDPSDVECLRLSQTHPELLGGKADMLAGQYILEAERQGDTTTATRRRERRQLLRYLREVGVEEVNARITQVGYELRVAQLIGEVVEAEAKCFLGVVACVGW